MAVLAEAISVIVRRDSIEEKYSGGWEAFTSAVPNVTMCTDGEIVRVGFMAPQDIEAYVKYLETQGLQFLFEGKALDIVVADQQEGLTVPCDWLEFGVLQLSEDKAVAACWFFDNQRKYGQGVYMHETHMKIAMPQGWEFEGSLSQKFNFVPTNEVKDQLKFLRRVNNSDIYLDLTTGKEVAIHRTQTDE